MILLDSICLEDNHPVDDNKDDGDGGVHLVCNEESSVEFLVVD